jgi:hypothetical protein
MLDNIERATLLDGFIRARLVYEACRSMPSSGVSIC